MSSFDFHTHVASNQISFTFYFFLILFFCYRNADEIGFETIQVLC